MAETNTTQRFLDKGGLSTFWARIKEWVSSHVVTNINIKQGFADADGAGSGNIADAGVKITLASGTSEGSTRSAEVVALSSIRQGATDSSSDVSHIPNWAGVKDYVTEAVGANFTAAEKQKLAGIAAGAEVNQNAFSNIKVGNTTIAADTKTDTLTLVAGGNVTITPDSSGDKITISANDSTYTPASASPLMDGTAAVGSSEKYAREDHVHPSDTSRANKSSQSIANDTAHADDYDYTQGKKITIDTASGSQNVDVVPHSIVKGSPVSSNENTKYIPTWEGVMQYVSTRFGGVTIIQYAFFDSFSQLPAAGAVGTIYLVKVTNPVYTYTKVTSPSGSPKTKGYYYVDANGDYVAATETTVTSGRTYYTRSVVDEDGSSLTENSYDEYIWNTSASKYESIGRASLKLEAITAGEIDAICV